MDNLQSCAFAFFDEVNRGLQINLPRLMQVRGLGGGDRRRGRGGGRGGSAVSAANIMLCYNSDRLPICNAVLAHVKRKQLQCPRSALFQLISHLA